MELSKEELTKYLLQSAETLGEVKGLVGQILEHYKSFNGDRKDESKAIWSELKGLSNKIDKGQEENRQEIKQLVSGMTSKIEENSKSCELRDDAQNEKIATFEKSMIKQAGFVGGVSAAVSVGFTLLTTWLFRQ